MIVIETLRGREKELIEVRGNERPVNFFFARFIHNSENENACSDFESYVRVDALSDHLRALVVGAVP
jgi:hypothetical protein